MVTKSSTDSIIESLIQTINQLLPPMTKNSDWYGLMTKLVTISCFSCREITCTIPKYNVLFQLCVCVCVCRDGNGAGRGRVSLSHTHPCIKNSSPSPYPNPTGINILSHPHPQRVTGIISYPYPYPCSNYFNINFYKRKKITVKKT